MTSFDTVYKDVSSLRYGKLVIMADQDFDGSHIKGLVINFFQYFWPSLLKLGFLQQFITPIVKATKGKRSFMFFTLQQYKTWLSENNNGKGYYIKWALRCGFMVGTTKVWEPPRRWRARSTSPTCSATWCRSRPSPTRSPARWI